MAHLTCVGSTAEQVRDEVQQLVGRGIQNILALRGDEPQDATAERPADGFAHATDLIEFVRDRFDIAIGAACYPGTHLESDSATDDLHWTKVKADLGASFMITQLFFDNAHYFAFVDKARADGINVPIVPGIMPIATVAGIRRMAGMNGTAFPPELEAELQRVDGNDEATYALGVRWAKMQCEELLARGVDGIHFYTLNRSPATREIYQSLFG